MTLRNWPATIGGIMYSTCNPPCHSFIPTSATLCHEPLYVPTVDRGQCYQARCALLVDRGQCQQQQQQQQISTALIIPSSFSSQQPGYQPVQSFQPALYPQHEFVANLASDATKKTGVLNNYLTQLNHLTARIGQLEARIFEPGDVVAEEELEVNGAPPLVDGSAVASNVSTGTRKKQARASGSNTNGGGVGRNSLFFNANSGGSRSTLGV